MRGLHVKDLNFARFLEINLGAQAHCLASTADHLKINEKREKNQPWSAKFEN